MLSLAERRRAGLPGSATGIGARFRLFLKAMKISSESSEESPELSLVSALLILEGRRRTLGGTRGGNLGLGLGRLAIQND